MALGRLDEVTVLLPNADLLLCSFVRKETVFSSQIEGTQSSLADLLLFEIHEEPGVPIDDAWEVSRYVAALEQVVDHLTEHGVMEPARLYESPFTDIAPYGPDGLFKAVEIDELFHALDGVRATASEAA